MNVKFFLSFYGRRVQDTHGNFEKLQLHLSAYTNLHLTAAAFNLFNTDATGEFPTDFSFYFYFFKS